MKCFSKTVVSKIFFYILIHIQKILWFLARACSLAHVTEHMPAAAFWGEGGAIGGAYLKCISHAVLGHAHY